MQPLISIITVTYNAEKTLPATIDSVDRQSMTDFEHLIIDGASKDSTADIARRACADRRMVFSEPDKGLYDAMNKGISKARGQYLIFLNAGDSFHTSDTLQIIADTIRNNSYPGIVYGQTQLVDADRRRIADRHLTAPENLTYRDFRKGMLVCHQAFVVNSRLVPMFDLQYRYSADYDWCIKCLQHSRKNICIPQIIIDYLSEGLTTGNHRASLIERFRIMCYYYGTIPTIIRHIGFIPRYLSNRNKLRHATPPCTTNDNNN